MDVFLIVVISVSAVILLSLIILFVTAGVALHIGTATRFDRRPHVKYFDAEDFGVFGEKVEFKDSKGFTLRGHVFGEGDDVIILLHGMGPGCAAYSRETASFVSWGYRVLCVDYRGCDLSDGKNPGSFQAGIECARLSADYVRKNLSPGRIFLWGHSWGAYSALCASELVRADGVVAVSAPESVAKIYTSFAVRYVGAWAACLVPFIHVMNFLRFGKGANVSASKCAVSCGVPVLLLQGYKDSVVPYKASAFRFARGENVTKILCPGKNHSPYNTTEAENVISEVNGILMRGGKLRAEDAEKLDGMDYLKSVEEDEDVMSAILSFYQSI
ncbi:MAG: alpha/beta hydrolase [Clostridia bacterium]|nr:alpha/beta hydrolase [Clostridia bacterium]